MASGAMMGVKDISSASESLNQRDSDDENYGGPASKTQSNFLKMPATVVEGRDQKI